MRLTSLRRRLILGLGGLVVGLIVVGYISLHSFLINSYSALEEQIIREHAGRARDALDSQLASLNSKAGDWASWDDTYEFVQDQNAHYAETNPNDTAFEQLGINLILIYDAAGQVAFAKGFDLQSRQATTVSPELETRIANSARTYFQTHPPDSETGLSGLIATDSAPMLLSARPILTSDGQGPARGVLAFGRYLDSAQVALLGQTTHLTLRLQALDELPSPAATSRAVAGGTAPEVIWVQPVDENRIAGIALLKDIDGQPLIGLRLDHVRDVYAQGQTSIRYFFLVFLIIALAIAGAVGLLSAFSLRAQRQHRDSEERYRALAEAAPDAIFIADRQGRVQYVNPCAARQFGGSAPALGRKVAELFPPAEPDGNSPDVTRVFDTNQPSHVDHRICFPEHDQWLDTRLVPIRDETGRPIQVLGFARDITERKRAEKELLKSEQEYRLLFANNPHPMWAYDEQTLEFLTVNDAAVRHYGYTRDEFLAMTIKDIRPPEDVSILIDHMTSPLDTVTSAGIWRHRKKDGSVILVEITSHSAVFSGRAARIVLANDVTERLRWEEQVQLQLRRLASLRTIDQAITASTDLGTTLGVLLSQVTDQLGAAATDILLLHPSTAVLECVSAQGFRVPVQTPAQIRIDESHALPAAREERLVFIPDLSALNGRERSPLAGGEKFRSYYAVPLVAQGRVKGVLELYFRTIHKADQEWRDFLNTVGGQAAIALDSSELFEKLQHSHAALVLAYDTTLEGWARALDMRDRETEGHTERVAELTVRLARSVGLGEQDVVHIRRGALLHDIGKMGIPDHILLKPGALTRDEWEIMRKHPDYAYSLLAPIPFLHAALDIPYCHHEKWNGTGYPRGLKGEQIPLAARLFAVVDVWDALRSDRPYRPAWPEDKTIAHLRSLSGEHFEPRALNAFLDLMADEPLRLQTVTPAALAR